MEDRKKLILTGALFLLCIVLVIVFFTLGVKDSSEAGNRGLLTDPETGEGQEVAKRPVTLYFVSEDDSLLHPEVREVLERPSVGEMGRQVVEELLLGSQKGLICPFPPETKLREFYLSEEGVAYVDFSREIRDGHLKGSSADVATVYSLVNSLVENFEEIKRVFILIDGRETQTLGGHIDLTRPFESRKDLIGR